MFDKGVIMIGDVSALDSLIKLYRPSFFNQYTKRSKLTDTNSTITIPVQETMGNIATGQTETKKRYIVPPTANPISTEDTPAADRIPDAQNPLTQGMYYMYVPYG
ncbi:PREDICTED: uncharacterized protein LOC109585860 [Amphimedon queenslandica]|uniref:Uncharacterized protein n=1 Tax=Amphimedon queenslandica TaxID=400682 RepID=A0AAN0JLC9_AMPQE|nr:PREDICTED: uncharacterized protein LOC109585860 [Amphimedon queenslandica]|eukprot:XP_019857569.1 PREDICTED: uncharacterized protein LOC109585860 [Amphimedon queenslandica]